MASKPEIEAAAGAIRQMVGDLIKDHVLGTDHILSDLDNIAENIAAAVLEVAEKQRHVS